MQALSGLPHGRSAPKSQSFFTQPTETYFGQTGSMLRACLGTKPHKQKK